MSTFLTLISLFLIILVGLIARKFNLIPEEASKYFNRFIFYVSVPSVVFLSIATLDLKSIQSVFPFIYSNILIIFLGYLITFFVLKIIKLPAVKKGVVIFSGNGGNVVYFGFPILLALYGREYFNLGVLYATVVITFGDLMGFYLLGLNKSGKVMEIKKVAEDFFYNPVVIATVLGIITVSLKFPLPSFMVNTLETLSKATTGLALFSLGVYLYGKMDFTDFKLTLFSSFLKLIFLPALTLLAVRYVFHLDEVGVITSVLLAAMPTAVFSLVVADAYGLDKKLTSNTIIHSSAYFLLTSIFWIWLLK